MKFPIAAIAGGEGWSHDFAAAKKQAAAEKKDLLLDFTGSDWCPPCKAVILAGPENIDEATKAIDEANAAAPDSELAGELDGFKAEVEQSKGKAAEKPAGKSAN